MESFWNFNLRLQSNIGAFDRFKKAVKNSGRVWFKTKTEQYKTAINLLCSMKWFSLWSLNFRLQNDIEFLHNSRWRHQDELHQCYLRKSVKKISNISRFKAETQHYKMAFAPLWCLKWRSLWSLLQNDIDVLEKFKMMTSIGTDSVLSSRTRQKISEIAMVKFKMALIWRLNFGLRKGRLHKIKDGALKNIK